MGYLSKIFLIYYPLLLDSYSHRLEIIGDLED